MAKKLSRSQVARLGGLAVARTQDMALLGSHGGAATVERYGAEHMTRLALRKNGYNVNLATAPRDALSEAASAAQRPAAIGESASPMAQRTAPAAGTSAVPAPAHGKTYAAKQRKSTDIS